MGIRSPTSCSKAPLPFRVLPWRTTPQESIARCSRRWAARLVAILTNGSLRCSLPASPPRASMAGTSSTRTSPCTPKSTVLVRSSTVSNVDIPETGAGPSWYLLDTSCAIKPLICQERLKPELDSKTDPTKSDHVFDHDEYVHGVRARNNGGFVFWQMACLAPAVDRRTLRQRPRRDERIQGRRRPPAGHHLEPAGCPATP